MNRDLEHEQYQRGIIYELLLEILDPKAYRAFVQTKLMLEAEHAAALAKASLASRIFLRTVEKLNNQIMKGEIRNED